MTSRLAAAAVAALLMAGAAPLVAGAASAQDAPNVPPPPPPPPSDSATVAPPPPPPQGDIVNKSTEDLFNAVAANDFAAVQAAVAAGAELDAVDRYGLTPVDIAIDKGHYQIAHFLLSVRNFRPPEGDRVLPAAPVPPRPAPVPRAPAGAAGAAGAAAGKARAADTRRPPSSEEVSAAYPPAPAEPQPDPRFAWPEDESNPFNPANPVFGGVLPTRPTGTP